MKIFLFIFIDAKNVPTEEDKQKDRQRNESREREILKQEKLDALNFKVASNRKFVFGLFRSPKCIFSILERGQRNTSSG